MKVGIENDIPFSPADSGRSLAFLLGKKIDLIDGTDDYEETMGELGQIVESIRFLVESGDIVVKISRISKARREKGGSRWAWHNLLGNGGNRNYSRLVLIAVPDDRYLADYAALSVPGSNSKFVIFDLPFPKIRPMCQRTSDRGAQGLMIANTNPSAIAGKSKAIYHYQVSLAELKRRYGRMRRRDDP